MITKAMADFLPPPQHCKGCGWRPFAAHWTDPQCPRCGSKIGPTVSSTDGKTP